ncbi:MAG TPA: NAD(P)H-binding protein, partial [Thermoanaerobaculia bacterium]
MITHRVLLTGATGYVGGRLLAELERRGVALRCFLRRPESLRGRAAPSTELAAGDALDAQAVARALGAVDAAYYLIHSMGGEDFAARDREAARIFGTAAREAGVKRIIYLGGLGENVGGLSEHLQSRQETGAILRESGVPLVEFRASIVLGSGSLSFEMIRALVERLPVMICPRWVAVEAQPIAVEDVIAYLAAALDLPAGTERVYEI